MDSISAMFRDGYVSPDPEFNSILAEFLARRYVLDAITFALGIVMLAVAFGVLNALNVNRSWLYRLAVMARITNLVSGDDVWVNVLRENSRQRWAEIVLDNEVRIVGSIESFSYESDKKQLYITGGDKGVEVTSPIGRAVVVHSILLHNCDHVRMITFQK